MLEILNDVRIAYRVIRRSDEVVLRPEARSSDDDDIPHRSGGFSRKVASEGPGRTATRVARSFLGRLRYSAEFHSISVMTHSIYVHGRIGEDIGGRRQKVRSPSGL